VYGRGVPNLAARGLGRRCERVLEPNRPDTQFIQTEPAEWLTEALLRHGKNLHLRVGMGLAYGKSHARMENIFRIEGVGICLAYSKSHARMENIFGIEGVGMGLAYSKRHAKLC
jgi:hypothetical protein